MNNTVDAEIGYSVSEKMPSVVASLLSLSKEVLDITECLLKSVMAIRYCTRSHRAASKMEPIVIQVK
jgi:hypothetical protein